MHLDHAIEISEKSKFGMAKQIAEGLEYLHCVAKLVHGDICPNNIMVTRDGKQTIKIVDFGLARSIEGASCSHHSTSRNGRVNVRYQAPELGEENAKENFQTDVYAFGGVLNYIWTKENPWSQVKTGRQIERLILAGQTPPVSDHSILNVAPRLKLCWANDPNARPSISECKEEISRRYHSIEGVSAVEYCHQHNLPANEGDRFCYRLLRFHENPNQHDGLHAKKTNGTCSVLQHVQNGSKPSFEGSSYISITKNLRWVLWYGLKRIIEKPYKNEEPNGYFQRFVKIDMTKLGASTRVIDLSSRTLFYDAIDNTDARMAANYSENAQEILIKNKIPKQAIVSMYSFQPLGARNARSNLLYKLLSNVGKQVSETDLFTGVNKAKNYNEFNRIFDRNYQTKDLENALEDCMLMSEEAIAAHGCDRSMMSSSSDNDDVDIHRSSARASSTQEESFG